MQRGKKAPRIFLSIMFLTIILSCAILLSACNNKSKEYVTYENEKYGFSLNLPDAFARQVDVREKEDFIYFVDKKLQAKHPEHVFGMVGRIEIYDKKEFPREHLKDLEDVYGFRYLGESAGYYYGWAHATDVQYLPDGSEKAFRALEKEFDAVIGSFTLKNPGAGDGGAVIDEYSLQAGNQQITLENWYNEADLSALLGKLVSVTDEVLGSTADTYTGSHVKTLNYQGLVAKLFSPKDNGKEFRLMSIYLTSPKLQTPRGITVGSTLSQLREAYEGIGMIPDGRTDADNCAYRVGGAAEYKNIIFEVDKGIVKEIKLYIELQ